MADPPPVTGPSVAPAQVIREALGVLAFVENGEWVKRGDAALAALAVLEAEREVSEPGRISRAAIERPVGLGSRRDAGESDVTASGSLTSSSHNDTELNDPRKLSSHRLEAIAAECLRRWESFPAIPGSRRWFRNGLLALTELSRRRDIADAAQREPRCDFNCERFQGGL